MERLLVEEYGMRYEQADDEQADWSANDYNTLVEAGAFEIDKKKAPLPTPKAIAVVSKPVAATKAPVIVVVKA